MNSCLQVMNSYHGVSPGKRGDSEWWEDVEFWSLRERERKVSLWLPNHNFECFHHFYLLSVPWMKVWKQRRDRRKERLPFSPFQKILHGKWAKLPCLSLQACCAASATTAGASSSTCGWCRMRPWALLARGLWQKGQYKLMCASVRNQVPNVPWQEGWRKDWPLPHAVLWAPEFQRLLLGW